MADHPMEEQPASSPTASSRYVFEPPSGGDISLRSSDGKVFCLHSIILGLASSVFADMFRIGTQSVEVIDVAEDSEAIPLILGFIYPSVASPVVNTYELLEKSLEAAHKYNIEGMIRKLDRAISEEKSYQRLIYIDPLRLFKLSVTYQLRESQTAAAKAVRPRHCDFQSPDGVIKFASQYPSSFTPVIALMGIQSARSKMLVEFLFFDSEMMLVGDGSRVICDKCQPSTAVIPGPTRAYYPNWLYPWGLLVYTKLVENTWDQSGWLFTTEVLEILPDQEQNIPICQACLDKMSSGGALLFLEWAEGVKQALKKKLDELDVLYVL
jgi:hypothetical protein